MAPRSRRNIHVVLPAFDEEAAIGGVLESIHEAMLEASLAYEVIVVDDGSRDATASVVKDRATRLPITLFQHSRNLGLGATIRDGLVEATRRAGDSDVIVTMDADETHTPALIVRMVRTLSEGHDVIIASRYQPGSRSIGVPLRRRVLSYLASILCRTVVPIPGVRDFTCGFRAYRADVLRRALDRYGAEFIDQKGFQCMLGILLRLRRMNLIFGEVPFILRYDRKTGASKMDVWRTLRGTLALIARRIFER